MGRNNVWVESTVYIYHVSRYMFDLNKNFIHQFIKLL